MRADAIRNQIIQALNARPFEPFVIMFENGQQALVEHPECVAYDPPPNGKQKRGKQFSRLLILSDELSIKSTFDAVTGIVMRDKGEPRGSRR